MKTSPVVSCEIKESVALVTLNRPDNLNALSRAMITALIEVFDALRDDQQVRVVVLTGSGRAFCAGLDLKELGESESLSVGNPIAAIEALGKPVVGAINGYAITGGLELALACDFLIASEQASFADTHALVGVVPGWGLTQKLPALIGQNKARQMSFTGRFIDARAALAFGLVNSVHAADELIPAALAIAADIAGCDQPTLQVIRELMTYGSQHTLAEGLAAESERAGQVNAGLRTGNMGERLAGLKRRSRKN